MARGGGGAVSLRLSAARVAAIPAPPGLGEVASWRGRSSEESRVLGLNTVLANAWVNSPDVYSVSMVNEHPSLSLGQVDPYSAGICSCFVYVAGAQDGISATKFY
jgi:hypothetical protein